jgi:precorrin-6A/cobalt-precorrin-6A reductase
MILQLAGTSDARELALEIKRSGFDVLTTVVTENAGKEMEKVGLPVRVGRLTDQDFLKLIEEQQVKAIVDGSHPFAEEASKTAIRAAKTANVPYIRYERESQKYEHHLLLEVDSYEEAAQIASEKKGVMMLLTGSKTLQIFTEKLLDLPDTRVLVRMLPRKDNMEKCEALGFSQKNIIAMQGPFTKEFNQALYKQFGVTLMITKESGKQGSVDEKVEAALELGIETIVINRPAIPYGTLYSKFEDIINELKRQFTNEKVGL